MSANNGTNDQVTRLQAYQRDQVVAWLARNTKRFNENPITCKELSGIILVELRVEVSTKMTARICRRVGITLKKEIQPRAREMKEHRVKLKHVLSAIFNLYDQLGLPLPNELQKFREKQKNTSA